MAMLGLLCIWGALAAGALAAPAANRNWVPCLSTIKGYGFCEETLFWAGQSYPHQQIVHQQQPIYGPSYQQEHIYRPSYQQQPTYRPSYQHLSDYQQQSTYHPSYQHLPDYQQQISFPNHLPEYQIPTSETSPEGTDHIIVIVRPSEETVPASNSSEINALFDRLFAIMEDVRRENHKVEEERLAREPTFDYSQINEAFNKINQVTQKVAKLVFETAYLQQKLKENVTLEVPHYDQLDKIVGNIEKASVNISDTIAKLKQSKEKCSPGEYCESEQKVQKCSPEDKHCKSESELEKCSPDDEHCKSELGVEKCSADDEHCKSEHIAEKCSADDENCKSEHIAEKCSADDEHCKSEHIAEKCSADDEHCKSEHKVEKCSVDDEHCKSEHNVEKCSADDEHCKSEHIAEKCSADDENCKSEHIAEKCSADDEHCKSEHIAETCSADDENCKSEHKVEKCSADDEHCKSEHKVEKCSADCKSEHIAEKCSADDEHCKSEHIAEKCSADDEHCKSEQKCSPGENCESEHKVEKCSLDDEHCKSEHNVEKCSANDEHCKSQQTVEKCSEEGNCKPDQKVDESPTPEKTSEAIEESKSEALNATVPETVSKEIDNISEEVDKADSQVEDVLKKLEPEKGIQETVESITEILEDISKQPPKETTPVERDPSRLKKGISELDNVALINRLIEDVHDLAREGIDNLETVTANELSDADREKAFDTLVKSKYSNDETKSAEVTALDDQLASFGTKAKELIQKKVTPEDLSKTLEESPETDLAEKYEEVTKEDVDSLKEIINDLSASGVPLNKIQDLAGHLDDFDKEKKSVIVEAKGIDESTLDNILGEKRVREELSDFGKILGDLYGKGISQEVINNLDKKVSDLKDHSITEILSTLESRRGKREVDDETNVYDELYDLLVEVVNTNFEDVSVDAYVTKVDELTSSNVTKATIFETSVKVVTDIVDNKDRPKRAVKNVVEIPKNELFDAVEHAYKANFSESSVDAFFAEVDSLVQKGVEPFQILGETLSDTFLLMLAEAQTLPFFGKAENIELLSLVENAVKSDASEESMSAYNKKIEQLLSQGANPLQLGVDVIGDLFALLSREERPKREPIDSYKGLLDRLLGIYDRLELVEEFITNRNFRTHTHRKEHLDFLRQAKKLTRKWIQYTFEQIVALEAAASAAAPNTSVDADSDASLHTITPVSTQ